LLSQLVELVGEPLEGVLKKTRVDAILRD